MAIGAQKNSERGENFIANFCVGAQNTYYYKCSQMNGRDRPPTERDVDHQQQAKSSEKEKEES